MIVAISPSGDAHPAIAGQEGILPVGVDGGITIGKSDPLRVVAGVRKRRCPERRADGESGEQSAPYFFRILSRAHFLHHLWQVRYEPESKISTPQIDALSTEPSCG